NGAAEEFLTGRHAPGGRISNSDWMIFGTVPHDWRGDVDPGIIRPDRQIINVMKTGVVALVCREREADILQCTRVEGHAWRLFDHDHSVGNFFVELIAREILAYVRNKLPQVSGTVAVRNDDRKTLHDLQPKRSASSTRVTAPGRRPRRSA